MPPQGYYGKATVRRKKKSKGPGWSRPPGGGSARGKPPAAPRPSPQAPAFAPPKVPTASTSVAYAPPQFSGGAGGYDVSSDPAVAAASGLSAKIRANAQASALAKRQQAAIEYGDPTGVEGIDEKTSQAAKDNPFSVLKNLEHSYEKGKGELEEELNKANLFYSGYRGEQLGEAARGYQNQRQQAGTAFKGLQTDINDRLADALMQADMYDASAISGSDGGSYGGGGGDAYGAGDGSQVSYALAARRAVPLGGGSNGPLAGRPTVRPRYPATKPWRKAGSGAYRTQ